MRGFEVKDIHFAYRGGREILNGASLACEKGSVNVLLGLNGCGKTTLIKIMSGLLTPVSGEVYYCDKNIHLMTVKDRSKMISYVKQHGNHVGGYSVNDYLLMSTINTLGFSEEPEEEQQKKVDECLDQLNITSFKDRMIGQLSGGQRQMVSICAALVQDTDVIFLDEPTSALDMRNESSVLNILRGISKESEKIIMFSTHNPNHALRLNANVFLMKDGKIIDSGQSSEVIRVERLTPIYGENLCYTREQSIDEVSYRLD